MKRKRDIDKKYRQIIYEVGCVINKLNNQGKTIVIVIVCIAVLVSVLGALFSYRMFIKPTEINMGKYIKMEVEGYNGFGNAK